VALRSGERGREVVIATGNRHASLLEEALNARGAKDDDSPATLSADVGA
jgi:hypothetical protein